MIMMMMMMKMEKFLEDNGHNRVLFFVGKSDTGNLLYVDSEDGGDLFMNIEILFLEGTVRFKKKGSLKTTKTSVQWNGGDI